MRQPPGACVLLTGALLTDGILLTHSLTHSLNHSLTCTQISEMLLGPAPKGFAFTPKHKSSSYASSSAAGASGANGASAAAEEQDDQAEG
jgi:hypothetical protein